MSVGFGGPVTTSCGSSLFTATDFLDWGSAPANGGLGPATTAAGNPPAYANTFNDGVLVQLGSNMQLQRFDNTIFAYNIFNGWVPAQSITPGLNTFGGHFNAPDLPSGGFTPYGGPTNLPTGLISGPAPTSPKFGENLLGIVGSSNPQHADLSLSFAQNIHGAGFQVSSQAGTDSNFLAILMATDASGNLLGTYTVTATGLGGLDPGLNNPATTGDDPSPANNVPFVQFYDPQGRIRSIYLQVYDLNSSGQIIGTTQGAFIGQLYVNDSSVAPAPAPTPEPALGLCVGGLLLILGIVLKKRRPNKETAL